MKPFLAATCDDLAELDNYPYIVSPKLDGVRCVITPMGAVSRKLIPVPNDFMREKLNVLPLGLDGEIRALDSDFDASTSLFRNRHKIGAFTYDVFDRAGQVGGILNRVKGLKPKNLGDGCVLRIVPQITVSNLSQLEEYEDKFVDNGYEGIMIRSPNSPYKFGRSTRKEEGLMKFKRWLDDDAIIIGRKAKLKNNNPQVRDALGNAKRSKHKANMLELDTLGSLICTHKGVEFDIGSGFDDETAFRIWKMNDKELYSHRVKFKYKGLTKDKVPLFPIYIGLRTSEDF
jgi:DNA ligase 1